MKMTLVGLARATLPSPVYEAVKRTRHRLLYRGLDYPRIFTKIYVENRWRTAESVSGSGSTVAITGTLREHLEEWLRNQEITSLVDIPCGDFNWMRLVRFPQGMQYLGLDIVDKLISDVSARYETEQVHFDIADILTSDLPKADAYFCKDIFTHFPLIAVERALSRIRPKTRYILTTTVPSLSKNIDIEFGQDRVLNMALILGEPLEMLPFYEADGVKRFVGVWHGDC
jgi:hypothetical protein